MREEFITQGDVEPLALSEGVELQILVSAEQGAKDLTTCLASFQPGTQLPMHTHPTGEAITLIEGTAEVLVENRSYQLNAFDCMWVPAGIPHGVRNSSSAKAVFHTSFPTGAVERDFVDPPVESELHEATNGDVPETLTRLREDDMYEVSPGVRAQDLFAGRLGSNGVCGGYATFTSDGALPCHVHDYDESITIVAGTANCLVKGNRYQLSGNSTACVPTRRPHCFHNASQEIMAMVWVYAGDEPDRQIVAEDLCEVATND